MIRAALNFTLQLLGLVAMLASFGPGFPLLLQVIMRGF